MWILVILGLVGVALAAREPIDLEWSPLQEREINRVARQLAADGHTEHDIATALMQMTYPSARIPVTATSSLSERNAFVIFRTVAALAIAEQRGE